MALLYRILFVALMFSSLHAYSSAKVSLATEITRAFVAEQLESLPLDARIMAKGMVWQKYWSYQWYTTRRRVPPVELEAMKAAFLSSIDQMLDLDEFDRNLALSRIQEDEELKKYIDLLPIGDLHIIINVDIGIGHFWKELFTRSNRSRAEVEFRDYPTAIWMEVRERSGYYNLHIDFRNVPDRIVDRSSTATALFQTVLIGQEITSNLEAEPIKKGIATALSESLKVLLEGENIPKEVYTEVEQIFTNPDNEANLALTAIKEIYDFFKKCKNDKWTSYEGNGVIPHCFWKYKFSGPVPFTSGVVDAVYQEAEAITQIPRLLELIRESSFKLAYAYSWGAYKCKPEKYDLKEEEFLKVLQKIRLKQPYNKLVRWILDLYLPTDEEQIGELKEYLDDCDEVRDIRQGVNELAELARDWKELLDLYVAVEDRITNYWDNLQEGSNLSWYERGRLTAQTASALFPIGAVTKAKKARGILEALKDDVNWKKFTDDISKRAGKLIHRNIDDAIAAHIDDVTTRLYRGDTRSVDEIFESGFRSKGPNTDIVEFVELNEPSIFISASKSPQEAFTKVRGSQAEGYVYVLGKKGKMTDVNNWYNSIEGRANPFASEFEIVFENAIPSSNIQGAFKIDTSGNIIGDLILNPNFTQ